MFGLDTVLEFYEGKKKTELCLFLLKCLVTFPRFAFASSEIKANVFYDRNADTIDFCFVAKF